MTARPSLSVALAAWCLVLIPAASRAADSAVSDAPVEAPRPPDGPSAAQFSGWVQALASDNYAERKAATQKLLEAGAAAVEPVARAAESDDLELPVRCVGILRRLSDSSDPAVKQAAAAALQALARSSRDSLARTAEAALRKPDAVQRANVLQANVLVRRGRLVPPQVQVPGVPLQPRVLVRELNVEDNGRKVYIRYQTGAQRELLVRMTETIDGREKTSEFKAANTTDLRKQSEQAYELYAKHARDLLRRPVQIVGGNQAVPFGIPLGGARVQMHVNNVTGQREIRAEDNGRQVQINDTAGRDIVVRITETANGKPQTAEYKARNLDELKQQHPADVAALYEKYGKVRNAFQVVAGPRGVEFQVPLQPGARLRPPERVEAPLDATRQIARLQREADTARRSEELSRRHSDQALRGAVEQARQLSELKRQIWEINDRLKKLAEQAEVKPDELRRLADELEKLAPRPIPAPPPDDAPAVPAGNP